MLRRLASFVCCLAVSAALASAASASCGSEDSCPLDHPNRHLDSRFLFDVAEFYIDQNQPRVGTEDAVVGAIPGHHDEVRTVNRVTDFRATYRLDERWTFGAHMPYVSRTHEHIHHHMGEDEYLRWKDKGIGDMELSATRNFIRESGASYRIGLGLKTPTGKQSPAYTEDGEENEPSVRLGTGSWDVLANVGAEWRLHAPGKSAETRMPLRFTVAGRYNGPGIENYRHGADLMVHLGAEYPFASHLWLLAQANYRARAKDDVGDAGDVEEEDNTGGVALYATPGLRYDAVPGFSLYGLVQLPVYERVNGIQIVSESNVLVGISRSIF